MDSPAPADDCPALPGRPPIAADPERPAPAVRARPTRRRFTVDDLARPGTRRDHGHSQDGTRLHPQSADELRLTARRPNAPVAQRIEQRSSKPLVRGSSPVRGTQSHAWNRTRLLGFYSHTFQFNRAAAPIRFTRGRRAPIQCWRHLQAQFKRDADVAARQHLRGELEVTASLKQVHYRISEKAQI